MNDDRILLNQNLSYIKWAYEKTKKGNIAKREKTQGFQPRLALAISTSI